MRLIDASALQEEYKKRHDGKRLLLIDVAPTVDAVPVVRCKDCIYGTQDDDGWWFCYDLGCTMGNPETGDGFCSDGERKDGEQQ